MSVGRYEAEHRAAWERVGQSYALTLWRAVLEAFVFLFDRVCREHWGVATDLDTDARRVVVALDAVGAGADGTPSGQTVRAYYGRPTWTRSAIVDKSVRVWQTDRLAVAPEGRPRIVVTATTYVVDDVRVL